MDRLELLDRAQRLAAEVLPDASDLSENRYAVLCQFDEAAAVARLAVDILRDAADYLESDLA